MGTLCLQLEEGVGEGGREGSFDINRGTGKKKKCLSAQDAIFLSISIVCCS